MIRKQSYRILGPMTLQELKGALAGLEVTLSDEISASLKPWVFLDDSQALKGCYPEVVDIVGGGEDFPLVSESRNLTGKVKRQELSKNSKRYPDSKKRKFVFFATSVFALIALLAIGGFAFDYLQNSKKVVPPLPPSKTGNGSSLYKEIFVRFGSDWQSASDFVLKNQTEILSVLANEPAYGDKLMPYIRLQAFVSGGGFYEGVDSKLLYGSHDSTNCRVSDFRKLWKTSESSWKKVSKPEAWMKILMTHKNWLQSRWTEGWILPKTFEGACLFLAEDAFISLYGTEPLTGEGEAVRRRLTRLTGLQLGEDLPANIKSNHPLDILSCLEDAKMEKEIGDCLKRNKDKEWRNVFQTAADINRIHRGELPKEELGKFFPITQLDLGPERTIASELKSGKSLSDSVKIAQDQFPQFVKD
ncbi:MAG: hypothetical protein WCI18_03220 [Pseudomonadota bacterium]